MDERHKMKNVSDNKELPKSEDLSVRFMELRKSIDEQVKGVCHDK
jgi:hypothetical protein